jgi:hypothetical protein
MQITQIQAIIITLKHGRKLLTYRPELLHYRDGIRLFSCGSFSINLLFPCRCLATNDLSLKILKTPRIFAD